MPHYQLTKNVVEHLQAVHTKIGTLIVMLKNGGNNKTIYLLFLSIIAEFIVCCKSYYLHWMRDDIATETRELSEHSQINKEDAAMLEKIHDNRNNCSFDDFNKVYDLIRSIKNRIKLE